MVKKLPLALVVRVITPVLSVIFTFTPTAGSVPVTVVKAVTGTELPSIVDV